MSLARPYAAAMPKEARSSVGAIRNLDPLAFDTCWFHEYCMRSTEVAEFFVYYNFVSQKKNLQFTGYLFS
ncbi:hypothetical protein PAHAL_2G068300 [Panicum hallii]|uniref:Uncharacterized protein n=1 Tax=Panicum hallii TaxID=206008 RepID=A0A2T8KN65_9POAL|nr:hypothetical protein PAHAL_2G068300 [Panicum hallii]